MKWRPHIIRIGRPFDTPKKSPDIGPRAGSADLPNKDATGLTFSNYVVTEEFRVANAPVRLHFVADRQSGPILIKFAPERIKMDILPRICRGEVCFAIGMSEPGSGSDLFAAKTRATKTDGGFLINGTKIWTSNAHGRLHDRCSAPRPRPGKPPSRAQAFLVDMKTPGSPSIHQTRSRSEELNEVVFTTPSFLGLRAGRDRRRLEQRTSDLAYELSGPGALPRDLLTLVDPSHPGRSPDGAPPKAWRCGQLHTSGAAARHRHAAAGKTVVEGPASRISAHLGQKLPAPVSELALRDPEETANRATFEEHWPSPQSSTKLTIRADTGSPARHHRAAWG